MPSFYKQQVNDFVAGLDVKAGVVFDIGGAQNPVRGRTKSWQVDTYKILDLPAPHNDSPKPDIVFDINYPHSVDLWDWYFRVDLVFCLGVMDFAITPADALREIAKMLKIGGIAWVQFPFIYPIHDPAQEDGFRYSEPVIRRLVDPYLLNIEEIIYQTATSPKLREFFAEEKMSMAANQNHDAIGYIVKLRRK